VSLGELTGKVTSLTNMGSLVCATTTDNRLIKATINGGTLQMQSQVSLGYQAGQLVYLSDHSSLVVAEANSSIIHLLFARSTIEYNSLNLLVEASIKNLAYRPDQHKLVISTGSTVLQYQVN